MRTYCGRALGAPDHLWLSAVVGPGCIAEHRGNLLTKLKRTRNNGHIDSQARFVRYIGLLARGRARGVFELKRVGVNISFVNRTHMYVGEVDNEKEKYMKLTIGKMSGIRKVTS